MLVAAVVSRLQFARPKSCSLDHNGWLLMQLRNQSMHWEVPGLDVVIVADFWSPVRGCRCSLINNWRIRLAQRCRCRSLRVSFLVDQQSYSALYVDRQAR